MQYTSIFLAFLAAGFASASPVAAPDVSGAEDSFANLVARETQYHCGSKRRPDAETNFKHFI